MQLDQAASGQAVFALNKGQKTGLEQSAGDMSQSDKNGQLQVVTDGQGNPVQV